MKPGLSIIAHVYIAASRVHDRRSFLISTFYRHISIVKYSNPTRLLPALVVSVSLLYWSSETNATVVVVRILPNEIIMGVDSMRVIQHLDKTFETIYVCKIRQVGDVFFANAGLGGQTCGMREGAAPVSPKEFQRLRALCEFDVDKIAEQALQKGGTLIHGVQTFQDSVTRPLVEALKTIKVIDPEQYEAYRRGSPLNVLFASFENGMPLVVLSEALIVENPIGSVGVSFDPPTVCPSKKCNPPISVGAGMSQRAQDLDTSPVLWRQGAISGVRNLVKISIEDRSKEAGGPIHIIRLTKGCVEWIGPEPECVEEAKKNPCPSPTTQEGPEPQRCNPRRFRLFRQSASGSQR